MRNDNGFFRIVSIIEYVRAFSLTAMLLFSFFSVRSQNYTTAKENPGVCFDNFQLYVDKNVDSALYFVRLLASNPKYSSLLQNLLHQIFALRFQPVPDWKIEDSIQYPEAAKRVKIAYQILDGMINDTNENLVKSVTPIYYWAKAQQNGNKSEELIGLTKNIIKAEQSVNDLYQNRTGRYALLIFKIISQKKELSNLAEQLFEMTISKLKLNQIHVNMDTASRQILEKRAWYRYLYAYSNFVKATLYSEKGNEKKAGRYFKVAFEYSPDLTDNDHFPAYFYDMYLLTGKEKRSFQEEYINYLIENNEDKMKIISSLLVMALSNPVYKEKLKKIYNTNYSDQEGFDSFWLKSINKNLKTAPDFSINKIDGTIFSTFANKGKWILLDFWGTWCGPCVEEHPGLQKFYQYTRTKQADNFVLLTIACRDVLSRVKSYIAKYNYDFPVAMADGRIESVFKIHKYPSKILITPQGKYLIVPFGEDWTDFIEKYADL